MKTTTSIALFIVALFSLNSCIVTKTVGAAVDVTKTAVGVTGAVAKAGINAVDGDSDNEDGSEEEKQEDY